ncbi:hypothetical protein RJT34_28076 [Clitoria ternatea]|uniref:Uncharacterized protein n=1 Tax=Clitoria ternatea TaxID=43366 RepID=A0AAN9F8U8_CLITE
MLPPLSFYSLARQCGRVHARALWCLPLLSFLEFACCPYRIPVLRPDHMSPSLCEGLNGCLHKLLNLREVSISVRPFGAVTTDSDKDSSCENFKSLLELKALEVRNLERLCRFACERMRFIENDTTSRGGNRTSSFPIKGTLSGFWVPLAFVYLTKLCRNFARKFAAYITRVSSFLIFIVVI